jgi:hypothetical protein
MQYKNTPEWAAYVQYMAEELDRHEMLCRRDDASACALGENGDAEWVDWYHQYLLRLAADPVMVGRLCAAYETEPGEAHNWYGVLRNDLDALWQIGDDEDEADVLGWRNARYFD